MDACISMHIPTVVHAAAWAAETHHGLADRDYLPGASLAHLTRKTKEARFQRSREWIRRNVMAERRYRPPQGRQSPQGAPKGGEGVRSRYFRFLSGHAAIGPYLTEKAKTIRPDKC